MGFPKGASIPFGRERDSNPARDFNLIECAVAGKSRVIVSGDKDLKSLGTYRNISILTPVQFLESLGESKKLR